MQLGAHESIAGGIFNAPYRGQQATCDTIQIFNKSNNQWKAKELKQDEVDQYFEALAETGVTIACSHNSYLINIASPNPALEEKSFLALLHHPMLKSFWLKEMGEDTYNFLKPIIPQSWILDPRELPPHAAIPDLYIGGNSVDDWNQLTNASQKERELVIKPSGFSELAWGSHGVSIGHDLSSEDWGEAIENALNSFEQTPYVLQEFHKGKTFLAEYYDFYTDSMVRMNGRVRLCPYYLVVNNKPRLSGILATICPSDKKILHGMVDAIMVPCAVLPG